MAAPSPSTSPSPISPPVLLASSPSTLSSEAIPRKYNTDRLGSRVGVDVLAAGAAGVLVAPIITMIDKGIIENASGRRTLGESLKSSLREVVSKPGVFFAGRPFRLIFSLYFGTYLTANTLDTTTSTLRNYPPSTITSGAPKFLTTSTANLALCLYKDSRFTQLFSTSTPRPVPLPTFALFTLRDCLTVFASFNVPPLLAPHLSSTLGDGVQKYVSASSAAQILAPAAVQVVSTPLHLLGLDLYNRGGVGMWGVDGRARRVVRDWGVSCLARMGRIVPAFGVGGVVNTKVRRWGMERLEE